MNFKKNLSEIRKILSARTEKIQTISHFLISRGITPAIAEEIIQSFSQKAELSEIPYLLQIISQRIKIAGELSFTTPHKIVLVGPTGVGKTATLMKLAYHYLRLKKRVAVTSLDEEKKQLLQDWAESVGVYYLNAAEEREVDIHLVDTEGCNYYQPYRIEKLGEKIATWSQNSEILLTLSVSAKEVDLYGAIHQFSPLCPSSLIFTKFDETLASGVVMNIAAKTDIPIRYIAYGFPLPGEIKIAEAEVIAHKILSDFNEETFQLLRQL